MTWRTGSSPVISRSIQASTPDEPNSRISPVDATLERCSTSRWSCSTPICRLPSLRPGRRRRRRPGGPPGRRGEGRRGRALVPTGIRLAIPDGLRRLRPAPQRSGPAPWRSRWPTAPGLIDSGYRDELAVIVINTDPSADFEMRRGDRIAQLVVQRVEQAAFVAVAELPGIGAGLGGFGHTGQVGRCRNCPKSRPWPSSCARSACGRQIERAEVAALSALKTYEPPDGVARRARRSTRCRRRRQVPR